MASNTHLIDHRGDVAPILLGLRIVRKYGELIYQWSVYLPG